jgi:hypothetical protein
LLKLLVRGELSDISIKVRITDQNVKGGRDHVNGYVTIGTECTYGITGSRSGQAFIES